MKFLKTILLINLFLIVIVSCSDKSEQVLIDIFMNEHLVENAILVNGKIDSGLIVTTLLSNKADSSFAIRNLNIDISEVNLAQIHFRLISPGKIQDKPTYVEVIAETSSGKDIVIPWFPLRAYDKNGPFYMTKSCAFAEIYGKYSHGKDFGPITGFRVHVDTRAEYVLSFNKIQILIDKEFDKQYPDDPLANPNWKSAKIEEVFAISGSDRVLLNELNSPLKNNNTIWKNNKIVLSGARNETVPFQLILSVPLGNDGVNNVDVRFNGVQNNKYSINNSKAENKNDIYNYVGRSIQLYKCRYILYDKIDVMEGENSPAAEQMLGKFIPEMLIPFEAKWGGSPFSIFAGQTQSVWIDTYIPKDAHAGIYTGEVEVLVNSKIVKKIPIKLTVHNFSLPNTPSTHALFAGSVPTKHNLSGDSLIELEKTYRRFFRRNYMEMFRGISDEEIESEKAWSLRNASTFSKENGYEGVGENLSTPIIYIKMYGGGKKPFGGEGIYGNEDSWHKGLLKYKIMIDKYAPKSQVIYYAWDEPSHAFPGGIDAFKEWMNIIAPWVHSFNKKYNANIKIYATTDYEVAKDIPDLDIYATTNPEQADSMIMQGDINCRYNGPQGIMEYASALRICGWQAFYTKTDIWWYWAFDSYNPGFDIYKNPYNFLNQYGELGAGTGMFVYPGTDKYIAKRNPGLLGPIPGIRLFNFRQGFIDYEYLKLASEKDAQAVSDILSSIVSNTKINMGLPDVSKKTRYPVGGNSYSAAREKLINIIINE